MKTLEQINEQIKETRGKFNTKDITNPGLKKARSHIAFLSECLLITRLGLSEENLKAQLAEVEHKIKIRNDVTANFKTKETKEYYKKELDTKKLIGQQKTLAYILS